jgi:hypothetical protein
MAVTVDGVPRYSWRVSTARRGYVTPPGTYHPEMLARHWFSRKYYNSPKGPARWPVPSLPPQRLPNLW